MSSLDAEHQQVDDEINEIGISKGHQNTNYCASVTLRIVFSTPGLVILVVLYSVMGAFIFPLLEAPMEVTNSATISKSREECLKELWIITERLNVLYERNWTMLVHEQLRRFEGSIVAATKGGFAETMGDRFPRWSFSEALLYSVTVITTIGHGNLTPQTSEGKIVTMLYALIGVPLMLMCLSSLGGLLASALQCTYGKLCGKKSKNCRDDDNHEFEEIDCNVCKYESVSNEMKQQSYGKYTAVSDRDDSCHLIRSPQKSITSTPQHCAPCNNPHLKNNQQQKNNKQPERYYVSTTNSTTEKGNSYFPSTLSTGGGGGGVAIGGGDVLNACADSINGCTTDGSGNILLPCHQHTAGPQKYQTLQFTGHLGNNERNNHLVVYHTATVHGLGRSKFIPKPIPQEINMLLAECELNNCQVKHNQDSTNMKLASCINECNVDEDDDEDNRNGCSHDTPSRIPLIAAKHQQHPQQPSASENEMLTEEDDDENDANNRITNQNTPQVPITIILLILISYICLGTVIFSIWENWSVIDGAYFCFVTLSTIGFGDIIPKKTFRGPELQLFACCAYLMLGLVLVAMSFSLLETQLLWKCRRMAVRLKLAKD